MATTPFSSTGNQTMRSQSLRALYRSIWTFCRNMSKLSDMTECRNNAVLHFSLASAKLGTVEDVHCLIIQQLERIEREYGLPAGGQNISARLLNLVQRLYEKKGRQVVVLIDEYDSPMLERFHDKEKLSEVRDILKNFYSPI